MLKAKEMQCSAFTGHTGKVIMAGIVQNGGSNSKAARRAAPAGFPTQSLAYTWVKGLSEESGFTTTLEKHQHKHKLGWK